MSTACASAWSIEGGAKRTPAAHPSIARIAAPRISMWRTMAAKIHGVLRNTRSAVPAPRAHQLDNSRAALPSPCSIQIKPKKKGVPVWIVILNGKIGLVDLAEAGFRVKRV